MPQQHRCENVVRKLMDNFKNLSNHLLADCRSFFEKYDFEVIADQGSKLMVENPSCYLKFLVDERFDYWTDLKVKGCAYNFGLSQVISFLMPVEASKEFDTPFYRNLVNSGKLFEAIKIQLKFVDKYLPNIITGDTSWTADLMTDLEYQNKLLHFMNNNLPHEHAINQQFWSGDGSWRLNLETYLRQQGISLAE